MQAEERPRPVQAGGQLGDRDAGRVAAQQGGAPGGGLEEHRPLQVEPLRDGLHDDVGTLGDLAQSGPQGEPRPVRHRVVGGQLAALHAAFPQLPEAFHGGGAAGRVHLDQLDRVARAGRHVGDAEPHRAGPDNHKSTTHDVPSPRAVTRGVSAMPGRSLRSFMGATLGGTGSSGMRGGAPDRVQTAVNRGKDQPT